MAICLLKTCSLFSFPKHSCLMVWGYMVYLFIYFIFDKWKGNGSTHSKSFISQPLGGGQKSHVPNFLEGQMQRKTNKQTNCIRTYTALVGTAWNIGWNKMFWCIKGCSVLDFWFPSWNKMFLEFQPEHNRIDNHGCNTSSGYGSNHSALVNCSLFFSFFIPMGPGGAG